MSDRPAVPAPDSPLAVLREALAIAWPEGDRAEPNVYTEALAALDRVEAELARLNEYPPGTTNLERHLTECLQAAEAKVARLRDGLRPEPLARLFHETYETLAPFHGYKTRKDSAVSWDEVPAANKALMIATADTVARALLAEDGAPPIDAETWGLMQDGAA